MTPTTVRSAAAGLLRPAATVLMGFATTVPSLGAVVLWATAWMVPGRTRRRVAAVGERVLLAAGRADLRRLRRLTDDDLHPEQVTVGYAAAHMGAGLLAGVVVVGTAGVGIGYVVVPLVLCATGQLPVTTMLVSLTVGLVACYLAARFTLASNAVDVMLARRLVGRDRPAVLQRRIARLDSARTEIVAAVDEERRRIERDLHDGVQQRVVALSMLLGRARRTADPDRAAQLYEQAHEESQQVLRDLRDVAWRVHPAALMDGGLPTALAGVAERTAVPVRIECTLTGRLPSAVETAAYFVVSEAVTNTVKHAAATTIAVRVHRDDRTLTVHVEDDGRGGADPDGSGLTGLALRLRALDGRLDVTSPTGGPTIVRAELPCG